MNIFWRTLVLMVLLVAIGTLGYFSYVNMASIDQSGQVAVTKTNQTSEAPMDTAESTKAVQTEQQTQEPGETSTTTQTGPKAPSPLVFETSGVMSLPSNIAHHDWTKELPVVIVVDKKNTATLVLQMINHNCVYVVYQADNAIGKEESPTPPGPYLVASKTLQPTWTPPKNIEKKQRTRKPFDQDKENPLGVAAIRLNKWNIVLHGTNSPHSIGKEASHGCIRHRNEDILRIYDSVWKGTPVIVAEKLEGTKVSKDMFLPVKNHGG